MRWVYICGITCLGALRASLPGRRPDNNGQDNGCGVDPAGRARSGPRPDSGGGLVYLRELKRLPVIAQLHSDLHTVLVLAESLDEPEQQATGHT